MASESKTSALSSFFVKWYQGLQQLLGIVQWGFAIIVGWVVIGCVGSLLHGLLAPLGENVQTLASLSSFFLLSVIAGLFIPYWVGQSNLNEFSVRDDVIQEMEATIDVLANKHGLRWEATEFGEVDQLVRSGDKVEAARALRKFDSDMGLAKSMQEIADWKEKRLTKKLALLAAHTPQEQKPMS